MTWREWLWNGAMLTMALGVTVMASWLVFGANAFQGPFQVLAERWPLIYGSQAVLAALVGWSIAGTIRPTSLTLVLVAAAWLGELVVLTVGGNLLANEIDPDIALFYWLMATGGPIQPIAAMVGVGIRHAVAGRRETALKRSSGSGVGP